MLVLSLLVWVPAGASAETAYVSNYGSGNVRPIDVATRTLGTPIPVGRNPLGVAFTPDGKTAYVTASGSNTVTPIDVATGRPSRAIPVGNGPDGVAFTPDGKTAYVANIGSDNVTPIDVAKGTPGTAIPVGRYPHEVAFTPDDKTAYVTNYGSNSVTPIDVATRTPGTPIPVGNGPVGVAFTPTGKTAYITNGNSNNVTRIDVATRTLGTPIPVGKLPDGVAFTPDGKTAYVTNTDSNTVTPINVATGTPGGAITVGTRPGGVAFTPDGKTAYVTNTGSDNVTPIDVATGRPSSRAIGVDRGPLGVAFRPDPYLAAPGGTAPLIADSGFRPKVDGFSFANYGGGPEQNLTAAEMEKLFGRSVCENGSGPCQLREVARGWMDSMNKDLAPGGHCMGFSVVAGLLQRRLGKPPGPSAFGSATTFGLTKTPAIEREIAYGFMFQYLPSVQSHLVLFDARGLILRLRTALADRHNAYTLGVYKRDMTGGHAITPFAIKRVGAGRYRVLVYDNNFPGQTRAMTVNTRKDTWSYQASSNPRLKAALYDGVRAINPVLLLPSRPGLGHQPCFFCNTTPKRRKVELLWSGDPKTGHHSQLVISDNKRRRTGCANFGGRYRCVNQIPGAEIHAMLLGGEHQWQQSAVPSFNLRFGRHYTVTQTGSKLRRPARESVALIGDNRLAAVTNMALRPGQRDSFTVSPGMRAMRYTSQGSAGGTRLQLADDATASSYLFQLTTKAIPTGGASISFKYNPNHRQLRISVGKTQGTVRLALKVILSRSGRHLVKAHRTLIVRGGQTTRISYG